MRLIGGTAFAIILGSGAAVMAQSTPGTPTPQSETGSKSAAAKLTVTGCLQRGDEASTPATGTTGAERLAPGAIVLINAASQTTERQPADVTTYVLEGSDIDSMVGQKVEVTGTVIAAASAGGASPQTPDASATSDATGSGNTASRPGSADTTGTAGTAGGAAAPGTTGTAGAPGTAAPAERHEAGTVTAETPGSVTPVAPHTTPHLRVMSARVVGECSSNR
jgi:hypothetical protein